MDLQKGKNIIALLFIVFIPFALMLWYRQHQTSSFASTELIMYPLLFGGSFVFIVFLVKKYFLKEPFSDFNRGSLFKLSDLGWSLLLTAIYFVLFYVERMTLSDILAFRSNEELLGLMLDMREKPFLIFLWFLPVLWIGIALYEELIRVFLLSSLWKFSNNTFWVYFVIILSSLMIGLTHWSQGSYGIVTIAIKSIVAGIFFLKVRRLVPLIIAHALYDGIQVALLLITYPG